MPTPGIRFARHLAGLPGPRVDRARKHRLDDILATALCAVTRGADSFEEVERFGEAERDRPGRLLALPNGIPDRDTSNRVLAALGREAFAACSGRWVADVCEATGLRPIAVDGKAVRAAPGDTFSGCLHLVTARATENGVAPSRRPPGATRSRRCRSCSASWTSGGLAALDATGCRRS